MARALEVSEVSSSKSSSTFATKTDDDTERQLMHTRTHAIVCIVSICCLLMSYIRPFLLEPARLEKYYGPRTPGPPVGPASAGGLLVTGPAGPGSGPDRVGQSREIRPSESDSGCRPSLTRRDTALRPG